MAGPRAAAAAAVGAPAGVPPPAAATRGRPRPPPQGRASRPGPGPRRRCREPRTAHRQGQAWSSLLVPKGGRGRILKSDTKQTRRPSGSDITLSTCHLHPYPRYYVMTRHDDSPQSTQHPLSSPILMEDMDKGGH